MKTKITNKKIADFLKAKLFGKESIVKTLNAFPNQSRYSLSFLKSDDSKLKKIEKNNTIITNENNLKYFSSEGCSLIISENPKYDFNLVFDHFFKKDKVYGIHSSVVIGRNVDLHKDVTISPNVVVGDNVTINKGAYIGPNVILQKNVILKEQVVIRAGTILGGRAFSFGLKGDYLDHNSKRSPGLGYVIIEKNAEIGNNCVVSRGIFENTVIGENSRINDLTHIGNSVTIGSNNLIMANVDISARVTIGNDCFIAQSACIRQGLNVGNNSQIGMGSVVIKDIPSNSLVYGAPAKFVRKR